MPIISKLYCLILIIVHKRWWSLPQWRDIKSNSLTSAITETFSQQLFNVTYYMFSCRCSISYYLCGKEEFQLQTSTKDYRLWCGNILEHVIIQMRKEKDVKWKNLDFSKSIYKLQAIITICYISFKIKA